MVEKELEPWDGGSISADSLPDLGGGDEEAVSTSTFKIIIIH